MTTKLFASTALVALMATTAAADITLNGVLTDAADGNRFFTRLGGVASETVTYEGVTPGTSYNLVTQLIETTNQEVIDTITTPLTPEKANGEVVVTLPVPPNATDTNIDYITTNILNLADSEETVASITGDASDPERAIQVHAIQRVELLSATDGADGDQRIDGQGGTIEAVVHYANLVEGYAYTFWGQLLTPSGQAIGVFASISSYAPEGKAGEVTLTFEVPAGYEGISLVPSVGVYHQKRVEILDNGNIQWLPDAPNPVMIASDTKLDDPTRAVEVGVPFGQ